MADQRDDVQIFTAPEPIPLRNPRGDIPVAFLCGECKRPDGIYSVGAQGAEWAREAARKHCNLECSTCGAKLRRGAYCEPCFAEREELRLAEAWQKAKKVPIAEYPHGWLSAPDARYELFRDIDDLTDWCEEHGKDMPELIFGCARIEFHLDAESILESALDDHYEDAGTTIGHAQRQELQTFLDGWAERAGIVSFFEDHGLGIVIPDEVRERVRKAVAKTETPDEGAAP